MKGRKTGGRAKGTRNRATADVRQAAQVHTADAIGTLAGIMSDTEAPHAARVMAANALLDRGHGKPPQAITGPEGGPLADINITVIRDELAAKFARIAAAADAKAGRLIAGNGTDPAGGAS